MHERVTVAWASGPRATEVEIQAHQTSAMFMNKFGKEQARLTAEKGVYRLKPNGELTLLSEFSQTGPLTLPEPSRREGVLPPSVG